MSVGLQCVILVREMNRSLLENRFKEVMIPSVLIGIITNVILTTFFIAIEAFFIALSPALWALLFIVYFQLLKREILTKKQMGFLVAYSVLLEVFILTYFSGWSTGFYYYLFLFPAIFLLNLDWEKWKNVFFNLSIAILSLLLCFFLYEKKAIHPISEAVTALVWLFNSILSTLVMVVVMVCFSITIKRKNEALVHVNLVLENNNKEIVGQYKKIEILLKEVHHRVKNNLQIISSLISLEFGNVESEEARKVLSESRRRIEAIALIHQKLHQDSSFNKVNIRYYIEDVMAIQREINPTVNCTVSSPNLIVDLDTAIPLGLIISEIVTYSLKYNFNQVEDPELEVLLSIEEGSVELLVKDNGIGLSDGFDLNKPDSLGIEIVTALTAQIDGQIEGFNNKYRGSCFKVKFEHQPLSL